MQRLTTAARPLRRRLLPLASSSSNVRPLATTTPSFSSPLSSSSSSSSAAFPSSRTNTISPSEIAHFSKLAQYWWDPQGEFKLLHLMNPSRIRFIQDRLMRFEELDLESGQWLEAKSVLDVGCGGGIFAESLARLGADTLAIDASEANIKTATLHASLDTRLTESNKLQYLHCAAEDLIEKGQQFDVVCAMEVIEHVEDPRGFLKCLAKLTKPGGQLLLSTISRTPLAHLLTIGVAEHLLRFVTPGTHTYSKYIKPEELEDFFVEELGWPRGTMERRGCIYDPLKGGWRLFGMGEYGGMVEQANYFAGIRKPLE